MRWIDFHSHESARFANHRASIVLHAGVTNAAIAGYEETARKVALSYDNVIALDTYSYCLDLGIDSNAASLADATDGVFAADGIHLSDTFGYIYFNAMGPSGRGRSRAAQSDYFGDEIAALSSDVLDAYDPPTHAELTAAFTEIKGAGWTAETLKSIRDAVAGLSAPVIVVPVIADTPQRVQGKKIEVWTNEEVTISVPVRDDDGNTLDLTGQTFWFGAWNRDKVLKVNAAASGTSTGFTVTIPKIATADSDMEWVLRLDSATNEVSAQVGLP
ncbi:MAG: hypothetical protein R3C03_23880 [Pirellulaceae bacterium]